MAQEAEHFLWRGVLARAFLDLSEDNGKRADHDWFGSPDFSQVCTLADVKENEIIYIHRLLHNKKIEKNIILSIIKYLQLEKENRIDELQVESKPELQK